MSLRLEELGFSPVLFDGDICDATSVAGFVKQCEIIYHMAGVNRGDPIDVFRVNAVGAANIASAAATIGKRSIIFPSTKYIDRHPDSPYSRGKVTAETIFRKLAGFAGCKASILRLSNVYGSGALPYYVSVISTFCWFEASGRGLEMPIIGDGLQVTDFMPIGDVISELITAGNSREPFTFKQIDGSPLSVKRIAEIVRNPKLRKEFPEIQRMIAFFSTKSLLLEGICKEHSPQYDHSTKGYGETVNKGTGTSRFEEIYIETNQVSYTRFMHHEEYKSLSLEKGRIMLDIYTVTGQYIQSRLLDNLNLTEIQLDPQYQYDLRNIGTDVAKAQLYY